MANELVTSFLGAIQASLSVLLIILYGVVAAQFDILKGNSTKQISTLCVRIFLPCLLITSVGNQLHADTGIRYVPILIWGLFYSISSMLAGYALTRIFKLPSWVTPAISFNNTTALPLLLIQSLESTGILDELLVPDTDSSAQALLRAKSYFLVNAMVGDSMTFAMGPKLLDGEDAPEKIKDERLKPGHDQPRDLFPQVHSDQNESHRGDENGQANSHNDETHPEGEQTDEHTSLLPHFIVRGEEAAGGVASYEGHRGWHYLPIWLQSVLHFFYGFLHAPLFGAVTGAIIGLVPPFHKAFFGSPEHGGIFTAWLTDSVKNIGDLFPALQVVVVGVKLSSSMRKMKRGEDSGSVPWVPMLIILFIRFIMWPAISIAIIYLIASRTALLSKDPILWFSMMLMPTGPTAMKLTALADVTGSNEGEKMSIAKFLSITYALSPLICFTVVGSLKACKTAMGEA